MNFTKDSRAGTCPMPSEGVERCPEVNRTCATQKVFMILSYLKPIGYVPVGGHIYSPEVLGFFNTLIITNREF